MRNQVPVFHPSNAVQVAQAGVVFWRRARVLSRAVRPPAALLCVRRSGRVDANVIRQKPLKDTPGFAGFKVKYLQNKRIMNTSPVIASSSRSPRRRANNNQTTDRYQAFVGSSSVFLLQHIYKIITIKVWVGRHA